MRFKKWSYVTAMIVVLSLSLGVWDSSTNEIRAQAGQQAVDAPKFKIDPFWPNPLPDRWVTGNLGGVCVDAQDHVFTLNRGDLTHKEEKNATASPTIIEFDPDGRILNSWGNKDLLPKRPHGCFVDFQNNIWIGGNQDGIVQKYSHDGSKMLLQIGTKGRLDTWDGTMDSPAKNSSHTLLNLPASIAVDPTNGDVYIADGYGNSRVVVFDSSGHFLRQWGHLGTMAEVDAGVGGAFLKIVHCVVIDHDGLVYVCDREGRHIQVFDKMGNFKKSYSFPESETRPLKGGGRPCGMGFSPDPAQKFIYVADCGNDEILLLDRGTGQILSSFGRPGNQVGEFASPHTMAVNSRGDIIVAEAAEGRRLDLFRVVGK